MTINITAKGVRSLVEDILCLLIMLSFIAFCVFGTRAAMAYVLSPGKAICCSTDGRVAYALTGSEIFRSVDFGQRWVKVMPVDYQVPESVSATAK